MFDPADHFFLFSYTWLIHIYIYIRTHKYNVADTVMWRHPRHLKWNIHYYRCPTTLDPTAQFIPFTHNSPACWLYCRPAHDFWPSASRSTGGLLHTGCPLMQAKSLELAPTTCFIQYTKALSMCVSICISFHTNLSKSTERGINVSCHPWYSTHSFVLSLNESILGNLQRDSKSPLCTSVPKKEKLVPVELRMFL
jgi:hypothetical protein